MAALHPLPVITNVVRCQVGGSLPGGRKWANVVHVKFTGASGPPTTGDLGALATALVRFWTGSSLSGGSAWMTTCHNQVTLDQSIYYVLDGVSPAFKVTHGAVGAGGTTTLPTETAFVLTLQTAKRGRRYRGRIYLPAPIPGTLNINGQLAPGNITSTLAQWDAMVANLAGSNWQMGVATYGHSVDKHGVVTTWTPDFTPVAAGAAGRVLNGAADVIRHRKS